MSVSELTQPNNAEIYVNKLHVQQNPTVGNVLACADSTGLCQWKGSLSNNQVARITGTVGAYNVSNVQVISAYNPILPVTINSLAGGVDGQLVYFTAINGSTLKIKYNTSIGSDQPILTPDSADDTIPTGGNQIGIGMAIYDSSLSKWLYVSLA